MFPPYCQKERMLKQGGGEGDRERERDREEEEEEEVIYNSCIIENKIIH
jgi:hypothetical protein